MQGLDDLERVLNRPPKPGDHEAFVLPVLLKELAEHAPGEQQHVRFAELCRLAEGAFPKANPSDDEILKNGTTPHLMRYVLMALRNYQARVGSMRSTAERKTLLADAMGLVGDNERKGKAGKWTLERKMVYLSAFVGALDESRRTGRPWAKAYRAGLNAAYQAYREGAEGIQKGSERKNVMDEMRKLMAEHNYLERHPGE